MRAALIDFQQSLANVRDLINTIVQNIGGALRDPRIRILHETQQCGSVVLLTGYFEAFLKDVVKAFVSGVSKGSKDFGALPPEIQHTHFESGGRVLSEISKARRNNGFTPLGTVSREDVVERLYSPTFSPVAKTYEILWEAFADTRANPGPNVVRDIAKGLGVNNVWPKVAANSGSNHSDSTLSTTLSNLILVRNSCAHTGKVSPMPSTADILTYIDTLDWIAVGFVQTLENELQNY